MGEVVFVISMSLDGFITGPDVSAESPLGRDGERLHDWMFDRKTDPDAEIVDETSARSSSASECSTSARVLGATRRRSTCRCSS
jgi:hypothetical protein